MQLVRAHQNSNACILGILITAGLFILPYVFGGELWRNRIRSFGASFSQCFHWLFRYAVGFVTPSILESMDKWVSFIFFGSWCTAARVCVFFFVPETSGLGVEEIDYLFEDPRYAAYKLTRNPATAQPEDPNDSSS